MFESNETTIESLIGSLLFPSPLCFYCNIVIDLRIDVDVFFRIADNKFCIGDFVLVFKPN